MTIFSLNKCSQIYFRKILIRKKEYAPSIVNIVKMVGSLLFLKNILGMDFQKIASSNKDCSNEHSLIHCKFKGEQKWKF